MQFYLIRLSYTAASWHQQLERTPDIDRRLASVKRLIANLGGSLARYEFFADGHGVRPDGDKRIVIEDKFIALGADDLVALIAVPDERAAFGFSMAVSAEAGVKQISLTPLLPIRDAIEVMRVANTARSEAAYSAPGGTGAGWLGADVQPGAGRRRGTGGARTARGGGAKRGSGAKKPRGSGAS